MEEEKAAPPGDWKAVVRPAEKPRKGRKWAYAAVLIVIFAGAFLYFSLNANPLTGLFVGENAAKGGDTVRVAYTGKLEDGTVFDTTEEAVGKAANISRFSWEPLEFALGSGQVIVGFEGAILGMGVGQKKTVTITPDRGYGEIDPQKISVSPRTAEFNRTDTITTVSDIPAEQFLSLFGVKQAGEEFDFPGSPFQYKVLSSSEGFVKVKLLIEQGKTYRFPGTAWNSTILSLGAEEAVLRHEPGEREITTEFGKTTIAYTPDKILVTVNPEVGMAVSLQGGTGKVTKVDQGNVTIDFNHFLAGKTLVFEIELVEIKKV